MAEKDSKLSRFFKALGSRQHTLAEHENCKAALPSLVEAALAGGDLAALFPDAIAHLDTCPECDAEYAALLDLAMADDAGQLPAVPVLPIADAWFVPTPTLAGYVRHLMSRLAPLMDPPTAADVKALLEPFVARVRALGDRPLPPLAATLGEQDEAMQLLAATHSATRLLRLELTRAQLEAHRDRGTLGEILIAQAREAAREQGLPSDKADWFAEQYARAIGDDPESLSLILTQ